MGRAAAKIIERAERTGWRVVRIEWTPVSAGGEKSGPEGGWWADIERDGVEEQALGYNWQQAVAWIDAIEDGWKTDPFGCPNDCYGARGHRGEHFPRRLSSGEPTP